MNEGRTMRGIALICKGNRWRKPMIENHRVVVGGASPGGGRPPSIRWRRGGKIAASKPPRGLPPRGVQSHTHGPLGLARAGKAEFYSLAPEGRGGRVVGFQGSGLWV